MTNTKTPTTTQTPTKRQTLAADRSAELGAPSLSWVSRKLGLNKNGNELVPNQRLRSWYVDKPALFEAVVIGLVNKFADELGGVDL